MKDWRERYSTIYAEDQEYWSGKGFEEVESARGEVSFRGTVTVRRKGEEDLERHDAPPSGELSRSDRGGLAP